MGKSKAKPAKTVRASRTKTTTTERPPLVPLDQGVTAEEPAGQVDQVDQVAGEMPARRTHPARRHNGGA